MNKKTIENFSSEELVNIKIHPKFFFDGNKVNPQTAKISLSKQNSKIGKMYNLNLLPGDSPIENSSGILTNVTGTCNGCCENCKSVCYAINSEKFRCKTNIPAHATNTIIAKENLPSFFSQLQIKLRKSRSITIFRYHSFGEIPSYDYLLKMVETAQMFPEITFYFYTKRFGWIETYIRNFKEFPSNLVCNISEWHGNSRHYHLKGLNKFVYCDSKTRVAKGAVFCPAVDKNGHETGITCDKCGRCYRGNDGHVTYVHAH